VPSCSRRAAAVCATRCLKCLQSLNCFSVHLTLIHAASLCFQGCLRFCCSRGSDRRRQGMQVNPRSPHKRRKNSKPLDCRCARAATDKAECDRDSLRVVALECMNQYVAARREFVAACRDGGVPQQAASEAHTRTSLQQLYAKCDEIVSAAYHHCDSQLKAWQQQRALLLHAHSQSIQQLQASGSSASPTCPTARQLSLTSHRAQGRLSHEISFRHRSCGCISLLPLCR
jgi:hypothetical protein